MSLSPLKDILTDSFLTFVANKLGNERQLFLVLRFKSSEIDHWEYDNRCDLQNINLAGLRAWRDRKELPPMRDSIEVREIYKWILQALENGERKDIVHGIEQVKDIEEVIDILSTELTKESRINVFDGLCVPHADIDAVKGKPLKQQTTEILRKWYNHHHLMYWKYQELIFALKEINRRDLVEEIIRKFTVTECKDTVFNGNGSATATPVYENGENIASLKVTSNGSSRIQEEFEQQITSGYKRKTELLNDKNDENFKCKKIKLSETEERYSQDDDTSANTTGYCPTKDLIDNDDDVQAFPRKTEKTIQLRPYQEELAATALKEENTIICAETNAGKTYVAFYIIQEHFRRYPNGKVAFLAPSNPLVDQQFDKARRALHCFQDETDITRMSFGQDTTEESLQDILGNSHLIFMTPQTLVNRFESQKCPFEINNFTMLIFDECHHVQGKTPYNVIMSFYRRSKFGKNGKRLPQILGLTASVGTNKAKDEDSATKHLLKMMAKMSVVNISTVRKNKENLKEYIDVPERDVMIVQQRQNDPVKDILNNAVIDVENQFMCPKVREFLLSNSDANILEDFLRKPPLQKSEQSFIQWISESKLEVEKFLKRDEFVPRFLKACFRILEIYAECLEMNSLVDIDSVKQIITDGVERESEQIKMGNTVEEKDLASKLENTCKLICNLTQESLETNPEITKIIQIIQEEYKTQKEDSRFMIFVKTRAAAKALSERLRFLECLTCQYLTGSQTGKGDGGSTQTQQKEILEKFKNGTHKCLIATSVASEGIDIPQCNLVIRYRFIANEISSLQMRGRIRAIEGKGKEKIIGTEREIHRESINVERMYLMNRAVENVSATPSNEIRQNIIKEEILLFKMEEAERSRSSERKNDKKEANFEVTCRNCSYVIVSGQNLRILKNQHHLVYDFSIFDNISRKAIKTVLLEDLKLTHEVTGKCGHKWGHIFVYNDCEFVCLSQKFIKIFNSDLQKYIAIKKWTEVPYKIPSLTDEEVNEFKTLSK